MTGVVKLFLFIKWWHLPAVVDGVGMVVDGMGTLLTLSVTEKKVIKDSIRPCL